MYAIGHVIFGLPLTHEVNRLIQEWEVGGDSRWTDDPDGQCGFKVMYHGSWPGLVGYCGVELCKFDETEIFLASKLVLKPTPEQVREARLAISKLDVDLIAAAGALDVYVVWSSS